LSTINSILLFMLQPNPSSNSAAAHVRVQCGLLFFTCTYVAPCSKLSGFLSPFSFNTISLSCYRSHHLILCLCCSKCCLLFLLPSSANYYSLFICCCASLEFKGVLLHACSVQSFIAKPVLSGFCQQVSESGTRCLLPLPMNHTTLELICLVLGSLPQNHILSGLLGKSRWPLPQSS